MKETPKQYVHRILGYVEGKRPLAVLQSTPQNLSRQLRGLSGAHLGRRPAPGKWSIREIVAHLAETEIVIGYRLRLIRSQNGTPIQAFDQDVWAKNSNYARVDTRMALASFAGLRKLNVAFLKSIPPGKLGYYGMHSERGKETLAHLIRLFAGHDINHLTQVARIRKQIARR